MPESSENFPICKNSWQRRETPIEFYNTFWPLLSDILIDSYNEAFKKKEMSPSQREAVITLIEKEDKDRTFLENWRPISLTNVDAKIASKVIATRIVKVLPEISFTAIKLGTFQVAT